MAMYVPNLKRASRRMPRIRSDRKDPYYNYNLRNARERLGYRLTDLAEETGIPAPTIAAYESLRLVPDEERAGKIAEALEKKAEELFPKSLKAIAKEVNRKRRRIINGTLDIGLSLDKLPNDRKNHYCDYRLRNAINESGYSLSYLELLTRIPISILEALENSEIALSRGSYLAKKIARALRKRAGDIFPYSLKHIPKATIEKGEKVFNEKSKAIIPKELSLEEIAHDSLFYLQDFENEHLVKIFAEYLLGFVDERARRILRLRYGFEERPLTLEEVGKIEKISRERVRQIIDETLLKLRETIRLKGIVYN